MNNSTLNFNNSNNNNNEYHFYNPMDNIKKRNKYSTMVVVGPSYRVNAVTYEGALHSDMRVH